MNHEVTPRFALLKSFQIKTSDDSTIVATTFHGFEEILC